MVLFDIKKAYITTQIMKQDERKRLWMLCVLFVVFMCCLTLIYVLQRDSDGQTPCVQSVTSSSQTTETPKREQVDNTDNYPLPDINSKTVHYFWCQPKMFEFHNYLSVLSVMKIVKPLKIVFHYTELPKLDHLEYNSWFRELLSTVPYIVLDDLGRNNSCQNGRQDKMRVVMTYLSEHGGLYVGENTIFSRYPSLAKQSQLVYSFTVPNKNEKHYENPYLEKSLDGFIGVVPNSKLALTALSADRSVSSLRSCSMYDFEMNLHQCIAISVNLPVQPKDIWYIDINFGKLSRLLFYGKSDVIKTKKDFKTLTPRISHYIWFGKRTMSYAQYLSVLSSLYVANLHQVYFHGDTEPEGVFWEKLKEEENVTHIHMELPEFVFGNVVKNKAHANDVVKLYILDKYGGVNQDPDVYWTKPILDSHLAYDAVMGFEWVKAEVWPETFNIGVFIAKKHSKFVQEFLLTMKDYRDRHWIYNSGCMPYRVYERFPDVLFADRQLQVLCYKHKCHPPWFKDYNEYYMNDDARYFFIEWNVETMSVHLTFPKPYEELQSQDAILKSKGMYAQLGLNILKKAGKI